MNEYSLCISLYGNWSEVDWKEPLLLCGKFENGWDDEEGSCGAGAVDVVVVVVVCWSDLFVDLIEDALFDRGGGKVDNGSGLVEEDEIGCNLFNGLEESSFEGNEGGCWFVVWVLVVVDVDWGAAAAADDDIDCDDVVVVVFIGGGNESNFESCIEDFWVEDKGCKIEEGFEEDKSDFADDDEFDEFDWGNVVNVLVVVTVEDEFGPDIEPLAEEDSGVIEEACCGGWDNEDECKLLLLLLFILFVNFEDVVFDEEGDEADCGIEDLVDDDVVDVVDGIGGIIDNEPPDELCKGGVWIEGFKAEEERPLNEPLFEFESNE